MHNFDCDSDTDNSRPKCYR